MYSINGWCFFPAPYFPHTQGFFDRPRSSAVCVSKSMHAGTVQGYSSGGGGGFGRERSLQKAARCFVLDSQFCLRQRFEYGKSQSASYSYRRWWEMHPPHHALESPLHICLQVDAPVPTKILATPLSRCVIIARPATVRTHTTRVSLGCAIFVHALNM